MTERAQFLGQVEKLVGSQTFHGSESLRKLLHYLAQQSLDHPGTPVKEHQIATEVFGRPSDFDPQLDSLVRVQAGRLRAKLAAYYESEGMEDHILVDLPKGSYALGFHHRPKGQSKAHGNGWSDAGAPDAWLIPRKAGILLLGLSVLLAASLLVIVVLLANRSVRDPSLARADLSTNAGANAALETFWKPFIPVRTSLGRFSVTALLLGGRKQGFATMIHVGTQAHLSGTITRGWAKFWPSTTSTKSFRCCTAPSASSAAACSNSTTSRTTT